MYLSWDIADQITQPIACQMLCCTGYVIHYVLWVVLPPLTISLNPSSSNKHFQYICTVIIGSFYNFRFHLFFCVLWVKLSVPVKLFVSLLCVCGILPAKPIHELTYTVSGGTLSPTHSLTHFTSRLVLSYLVHSWLIDLIIVMDNINWSLPLTCKKQ